MHLTNVFASNFCRSSILSPTPIYFTGISSSDWIATAIPPFAVPSSFVRIIPVTSATSLNCLACTSAFCPVVPSRTTRVSQICLRILSFHEYGKSCEVLPSDFSYCEDVLLYHRAVHLHFLLWLLPLHHTRLTPDQPRPVPPMISTACTVGPLGQLFILLLHGKYLLLPRITFLPWSFKLACKFSDRSCFSNTIDTDHKNNGFAVFKFICMCSPTVHLFLDGINQKLFALLWDL